VNQVLAVGYDLGSVGPTELAAAGRACAVDVVLVVDSTSAHVASVLPVLRRRFAVVDVAGLSTVDAAAEVARHRVDGVLTFSDLCLSTTAGIADRLGLTRWHSPAVTAVLLDKGAQRSAWAAAGLDTTRHAAVDAETDVAAALAAVGLPAVLKPREGTAGQHVSRVDDLGEALDAARRFFADAPRGATMVAEELLVGDPDVAGEAFGDYVSVEAAVHDGECLPLGVVGKLPLVPPFRERGFFLPATLDAATTTRVLELADAAVRALGVRDGIVHTELKLTTAGPRVLEVNGRAGGHVPDLFERALGYSVVEAAMRLALGERPAPPHGSGAAVTFQYVFLPPPDAETVVAAERLAEVRALDGIDLLDVRVRPGQRVDWRDGAFGRLGKAYGRVPDHAALADLVRGIEDTFHPTFTTSRPT
jgi:biotin carboxylase